MSLLPIFSDSDYIFIGNLNSETEESIREIIKLEGVLHWNREGEVRVVPLAILLDTFEVYDYWTVLPEKRQVAMPKDVGRIYWIDTQRLHRTL